MKKSKILVISFCLSTFTASCSQSEPEKVSESNNSNEKSLKSASETYINKSKILTKKELEKNTERAVLLSKRTISFNGEKYLFAGEKLRKGSQVRNIHMSEKGTIKGTFVIVVKQDEHVDIAFSNKKKIAKDTFRLIPNQTDDLMAIYNELLLNESIVIVELEVDYSGEKSGKATY